MGTIVYRTLGDFKQNARLTQIYLISGIDTQAAASCRRDVNQPAIVHDACSIGTAVIEQAELPCGGFVLDMGMSTRDCGVGLIG